MAYYNPKFISLLKINRTDTRSLLSPSVTRRFYHTSSSLRKTNMIKNNYSMFDIQDQFAKTSFYPAGDSPVLSVLISCSV